MCFNGSRRGSDQSYYHELDNDDPQIALVSGPIGLSFHSQHSAPPVNIITIVIIKTVFIISTLPEVIRPAAWYALFFNSRQVPIWLYLLCIGNILYYYDHRGT